MKISTLNKEGGYKLAWRGMLFDEAGLDSSLSPFHALWRSVEPPLAMQEPQEMQVGSLGQEDPLEEEMATYSSILTWRNPKDRGTWRATVQRVRKTQTQLIY